MNAKRPTTDSQLDTNQYSGGFGLLTDVSQPMTTQQSIAAILADIRPMIRDLAADWRKPRYALPSLQYFSPLRIAFAALYAFMVVSILVMASAQVWYAYVSGNGLDVSSQAFVVPMVLFLVAAVGAAATLRRVTLAHALRRQSAWQTVIAEYDSTLSPVEAGVMIDAYSNDNEAAAMLATLVSKGSIQTIQRPYGYAIQLVGDGQQFTPEERVFANYVFWSSNIVALADVKRRLPEAAAELRKVTYERMIADGDIPLLSGFGKLSFFVLKVFRILGFGIGAIMFATLFDPESYRIKYPRYPVELWQLSFIVLLVLIVIVIPLSAYYTSVFSKQGMQKYAQAAGLYLYIDTVLKGRFGTGQLAPSEEAKYLPYAQAFGLEPAHFDPGAHAA